MKHPIFLLAIPFVVAVCSFSLQKGADNKELAQSVARGEELYIANCVSCHMKNGEGLAKVFPPLAKSDYLMVDQARAIRQVLYGAQGEMVVNGETYNGLMSGYDLSDQQIADIMNYIQNSWGNEAKIVRPGDVKKVRK